MSGIAMAAIGVVTQPAANQLEATIFIQGGSSGVPVSTASGSTTAIPGGGERFFLCTVAHGTAPYTYTWQRQNGINKTELTSVSGNRAYVGWSGMVVGEYQSTTTNCKVRDATGATATSNTHVIGVTRTS